MTAFDRMCPHLRPDVPEDPVPVDPGRVHLPLRDARRVPGGHGATTLDHPLIAGAIVVGVVIVVVIRLGVETGQIRGAGMRRLLRRLGRRGHPGAEHGGAANGAQTDGLLSVSLPRLVLLYWDCDDVSKRLQLQGVRPVGDYLPYPLFLLFVWVNQLPIVRLHRGRQTGILTQIIVTQISTWDQMMTS